MKFNKLLFYLAGLILVITIGFNIYQYQRNMKFLENLSAESVTQEESIKSLTAKHDITAREQDIKIMGPTGKAPGINKLEDQLNATEEELNKANEQLSEELAKKEAFRNAQAKFQEKIRSDPAFMESIKSSIKSGIDRDYELLYGLLDLSPDKLEGFKGIVYDWRMVNVDRSDLINRAATDEEKEEAYRVRQEARDRFNSEFIDLMGQDKFKIYDDFKNRRFDRDTLSTFMATLPPENRPGDAQMDNLIDRMYESRTYIEKSMGFYDIIDFPSDLNEKTVAHEIDMADQVYGKYAEIGSDILPAEQAEQFKAYLMKKNESYASQVKMRAFIAGGKTGKN